MQALQVEQWLRSWLDLANASALVAYQVLALPYHHVQLGPEQTV